MKLSEDVLVEYNNILFNIEYDPDTGIFTWIQPYRNNIVGSTVGRLLPNGYRQVRFMNKNYLAHRLAWFYCFKEWPTSDLDHINRNRDDNRLDNLREVSRKQNMRNCGNTSKYGHNIYLRYNKFRVAREFNGAVKYFGTYSDINTAIMVRDYIDECEDAGIVLPTREELYNLYGH